MTHGQADTYCVQFDNVTKVFDTSTIAVENVDLTVGNGEFVTLLGPSGCGKSTLLRIAAGLEQVTSGAVLRDEAALRRGGTGLVFQEPVLMPWATVFDNVWMPLRLQRQSRGEARAAVERMLALVGLSGSAGLYPRQLSGGMQMRVAIARALITQPDLLLLDEPFAALDEIKRTGLNLELLRLRVEAGFTTLFVTHSVYESVFLSDRVIVMSSEPGRIFDVVVVEPSWERDANFRSSGKFADLCGRVSKSLAEAMRETAQSSR